MAYQIGTYTLFNKKTTLARLSLALILILLTSTLASTSFIKSIRQEPTSPPGKLYPDLSSVATSSMFAKIAGMGYTDPSHGDDNEGGGGGNEGGPPQTVNSFRLNKDFNQRPRDEPAVTVNPNTGTVVAGANDYGIGGPIGGGVYTHLKGAAFPAETYFPPFPLMCAGAVPSGPLAGTCIFSAPPIGTGDPALVYSQRYNEYYYTSIGFSNDNCASGVFLYRSSNGLDWTRPINKRFAPTTTGGGMRTIVYWDGGASGQDCSVFHDKEWIAVDNSLISPFYGRIYVTWTQFNLDPSGLLYASSPIKLAYSDNHGDIFSDPIDITGAPGNTNCLFPAIPANVGRCVEDQFSSPIVGTDGTVYVAFINGQFSTGPRDQYLVSRVHPGSGFSVDGPFQATFPVYDVRNLDYPTQTTGGQGRATLCNANFRISSTESLAIKLDGSNPSNDKLYLAWADDRAKAGQFVGETVGPRSSGYACTTGKMTDNDVFIIASSNQGTTWTGPIQVNQDKAPNTINNKDQFYPWVSVNNKGQVAVLYQDRRYDTTPVPNKLTRATVGTTTDLVNWRETLIAQFPSNLDNAFRDGAFIGDYNNDLITNDGTIYAVWTGVAPGKTALASDIYIAIFSYPSN